MSCPHHRVAQHLKYLGVSGEAAELIRVMMQVIQPDQNLAKRPERLHRFLRFVEVVKTPSAKFGVVPDDGEKERRERDNPWARLYTAMTKYVEEKATDADPHTIQVLRAILNIADGMSFELTGNALPRQIDNLLLDSFVESFRDDGTGRNPSTTAAASLWEVLPESFFRMYQDRVTTVVSTPTLGFPPETFEALSKGDFPANLLRSISVLSDGPIPDEIGIASVLPDDGEVLANLIRDPQLRTLAPLFAYAAPPYPEVIDACTEIKDSGHNMPPWIKMWQKPDWLGAKNRLPLWDQLQRCIDQRDWNGLDAALGASEDGQSGKVDSEKDRSKKDKLPRNVPNMVAGAVLAYRKAVAQGAISEDEARRRLWDLLETVVRVKLVEERGKEQGQEQGPNRNPYVYHETYIRDIFPAMGLHWPGDPPEMESMATRHRMEEHMRMLLMHLAASNANSESVMINYMALAPMILVNPALLIRDYYPDTPEGERAHELANHCVNAVLRGYSHHPIQHTLTPLTAATMVSALNYLGVTAQGAEEDNGIEGRVFTNIGYRRYDHKYGDVQITSYSEQPMNNREAMTVRFMTPGIRMGCTTLAGLPIEAPMVGVKGDDISLVKCSVKEIRQSDMDGAWFRQVTGPGVSISHTNLRGSVIAGCNFREATIESVNGSGTIWCGGSYHDAVVSNSTFQGSAIVGGRWEESTWRNVSMNDVIAVETDFSDTKWDDRTTLAGAVLYRCSFRQADLSKVQGLEHADVAGSSFAMAILPKQLRGSSITVIPVSYTISIAKNEPSRRVDTTLTMVIADRGVITEDLVRMADSFPIERYRDLGERGKTLASIQADDPDYEEVKQLNDQVHDESHPALQ
jgi:uncharacterized protein YjbI with pentapeptide repeats